MSDLQTQLVAALVPVLATAITAIVAMLSKRLDAWLVTKIENEKLEKVTRRLSTVIWDVVLELQQTQVDAIKEVTSPTSPGGLRITRVVLPISSRSSAAASAATR